MIDASVVDQDIDIAKLLQRRRQHVMNVKALGVTLSQQQASWAKRAIDDANLVALEREIRAAQALSEGRGLLAINVMRAVNEYGPSATRAPRPGPSGRSRRRALTAGR